MWYIINVIELSVEVKTVNKLSTEMLYEINGGDQDDYDFGYKVTRAAHQAWNAVKQAASDAWNTVKSWF